MLLRCALCWWRGPQSPPPSALSAAVGSGRRLPVVCVGDSITQRAQGPDGYLTLLANWYARRVDVVNRGFSGYNSAWLRALIDRQTHPSAPADVRRPWLYGQEDGGDPDAPPTPTALYTLCIGANDAVLPPLSAASRQFVPLDAFAAHVTAIAQRLRGPRVGRVALILITPPATDPHAWAAFQASRDAPPDGGGQPTTPPALLRSLPNTARYAQAVKDVAARSVAARGGPVRADQQQWGSSGKRRCAVVQPLPGGRPPPQQPRQPRPLHRTAEYHRAALAAVDGLCAATRCAVPWRPHRRQLSAAPCSARLTPIADIIGMYRL